MLVLNRRTRERIRVKTPSGELVWIDVCQIRGGQVRLGFTANLDVEIMREEVIQDAEARQS